VRRKRGRGEPLRRAQLTRGWEQIGAPARGGAGEGGRRRVGGAPSRSGGAVAFKLERRRRVGGAPARVGTPVRWGRRRGAQSLGKSELGGLRLVKSD
jgi:hypothetical protein